MRQKAELGRLALEFAGTPKPQVEDMKWVRALSSLREVLRDNVRGVTLDWDEYGQQWTLTVEDSGYTPDHINGCFQARLWEHIPADATPEQIVWKGTLLRKQLEDMLVKMGRAIC